MPTDKEKTLGITADRLKDHSAYYTQLSQAVGIGWRDGRKNFMNRDLNTWTKLYKKDPHLNNVPLVEFDSYYPIHMTSAGPKLGFWSHANTVCCLKTVIINKIKERIKP